MAHARIYDFEDGDTVYEEQYEGELDNIYSILNELEADKAEDSEVLKKDDTAKLATAATNLAGGGAGQFPYQSAANTTAMLAKPADGGYYIIFTGGVPSWAAMAAGHTQNTDTGTTQQTFQIHSGSSGPKLKNASGVMEIRNAADGAYANLKAGTVTANLTGNVTGNVTGNITGNVTGNCTGSSGSCTGNAATATLAEAAKGDTRFQVSGNVPRYAVSIPAGGTFLFQTMQVTIPTGKTLKLKRARFTLASALRLKVSHSTSELYWQSTSFMGDVALDEPLQIGSSALSLGVWLVNPSGGSVNTLTEGWWLDLVIE